MGRWKGRGKNEEKKEKNKNKKCNLQIDFIKDPVTNGREILNRSF